jgi:hypothetical protein
MHTDFGHEGMSGQFSVNPRGLTCVVGSEGISMKTLLVFVLTVAGLLGADATGTWTGSLTRSDGEVGSAHLILKQDGEKVTGTAGPGADEQHEIANGKSENGQITFELPRENGSMKFVLKQEGDEIKGEVTLERDGEVQKGQLAVTRSK